MLLSFSGIDGSGKSTTSALVVKALAREGLLAIASRPAYRCNSIVKAYCLSRYGDEYAYHPNLDADFYIGALSLDWLEWVAQHHDRADIDVVCCDRYLIDVYAQAISYGADIARLDNLFVNVPRPAHSFFLDIEPAVAAERLSRRAELPPHRLESLPELERLARAYHEAVRHTGWQFARLDASRASNEIVDEVISAVIRAPS